jgi:hypothetical protein
MTTRSPPWDEITTPVADYNVRLIPGSKSVPLFWGRDSDGHCLFIVQLQGDHSDQFRGSRTSVHGMTVDLRLLNATGSQGLVLKLGQHVDRDLFFGLCETLAESLREVPDSFAALAVALAHLKRWKAFLAGREARLLSPEEIRGLFAELQFLRLLYRGHLPEKAALNAWCGPEGGHQDFVFGNTAVETKALSGKERSTVRVSSEDQLEGSCDDLFLTIFYLSDMPESGRALSLNETVKLVESELSDSAALEGLSSRLAACGYAEMRDYDEPKLVVTRQQTYQVTDGFPRIVRSKLQSGLARVSYEIELESIASFRCKPNRIWGSK